MIPDSLEVIFSSQTERASVLRYSPSKRIFHQSGETLIPMMVYPSRGWAPKEKSPSDAKIAAPPLQGCILAMSSSSSSISM